MSNFGMKLKIERIKCGYSSKEFAELVGISRQYLTLLESGKCTNPKRELMGRIADVLHCTEQELFFDDGKGGE